MKRLIIAEKPDMARKIASALQGPIKPGQGFIETSEATVSWAIGHIMKSLEPHEYDKKWEEWSFDSLPITIPKWQIKVDEKKAAQFKVLKTLIANADEIINAGDPGREGQLIVDEILHYLNNKKPVKRILLYSLDKQSIRQAWSQLEDNKKYYPLYLAGVCRGEADFAIGMNATRAFTLMAQKNGYKGVLSVGRVQSPTLAIVVKRDEEIESFVPHTYYTISGLFSLPKIPKNESFTAYWKPNPSTPPQAIDSEKRLIDANLAASIAQKINQKPAKVIDFEESLGKEHAPLPFNLSKLQIFASSKWGMGAKDVLDTCQSLYEKHELQTYPRTDCQYLPENQFGDAAQILSHIQISHPHLQKAASGANPQLKGEAWNDKKLGEHFGLIPTKKQANLSELNDKEKKIYQAVCEVYIAQFYPACEFKSSSVLIECEQEHFKANGKMILKPGWKAVYQDEQEESTNDEESQIFPDIKDGSDLFCHEGKKADKKTKPPARLTEGTLIKAMTNVHMLVSDPIQKKKLQEKKGIGQEATRTHIIEKLFAKQLLLKQGKQLVSSDAGRVLVHSLPKKIIDPALTAIWEDALDRIANGTLDAKEFKEKQDAWIAQIVSDAQTIQMKKIDSSNNVNLKDKKTVSSSSTTTKKSSVGSVQTKTTTSTTPAVKTTGGKMKCPACTNGILIERVAKASGKTFYGCNQFPNCKQVQWPK